MEDVSKKLEEFSKIVDDAKKDKIRLEERKKQILKEKQTIIIKLEELRVDPDKADTIVSKIEGELKRRISKIEKELEKIKSDDNGSDMEELNKLFI